MRILLVEDDPIIAEGVREGLEEAHFEVDVAPDGTAGLRMARDGDYALLILDVMLPGMDGRALCAALRARRVATPILMLTARDALDDRVRGLEAGADDYLPKPFQFPELLARIRAQLRRDKMHRTRVIRIADLEIDTNTRRVWRAGKEIVLTGREYSLLEALAVNEGRILSREMIQEQVWRDDESFSATVNVHINHLRKKIDGAHDLKLIRTVYGSGYTLRGPDTREA